MEYEAVDDVLTKVAITKRVASFGVATPNAAADPIIVGLTSPLDRHHEVRDRKQTSDIRTCLDGTLGAISAHQQRSWQLSASPARRVQKLAELYESQISAVAVSVLIEGFEENVYSPCACSWRPV